MTDAAATMIKLQHPAPAPAAATTPDSFTEDAQPANAAPPVVDYAGAESQARFIPVPRDAVIERLLQAQRWGEHDRATVESSLRYLARLRQQQSVLCLDKLTSIYQPFNPDRELTGIAELDSAQNGRLRETLLGELRTLIERANFDVITEKDLETFLSLTSPYGVEVDVDLSEFEFMLLYARGAKEIDRWRRDWRWAYLRKIHDRLPIYQRLFIGLKLKPMEERIREIMRREEVSAAKALKKLKKSRSILPPWVSSDHVYLKLFKEIPQADLEMLFPNTRIKFKFWDKIKLWTTAGGGAAVGIFGAATKMLAAAALSPFVLAVVITGLIGTIFRQVTNFFNTRTKYMMQLAQHLYFHNLANNQGVLSLLVDEAEEEDIKEESLLYTFLLRTPILEKGQLAEAREGIEQFLRQEFSVNITFDLHDALFKLERSGLLGETPDGNLRVISPDDALVHLRERWMAELDRRPDAAGEAAPGNAYTKRHNE